MRKRLPCQLRRDQLGRTRIVCTTTWQCRDTRCWNLGASPRVPPSLNELQSSNTKPMSSRGAVNSGQDCMRSSRVLRVGRLAGVREPRIKRIEMAPPRRIVEDESCPKPPWGAVLTPGMLNEITFTPSAEPASYIAIKHCVPFPLHPLFCSLYAPLLSHPEGWLLSYMRS